MPNIIRISYQEIDKDCLDLSLQIKNLCPNIENIVAVSRGGLLPALLVSHYLGIRNVFSICMQSYSDGKKQGKLKVLGCPPKNLVNNDKTIFIDDLLDSGKTIAELKRRYPKAFLAVLYLKENENNSKNIEFLNIYGKKQPNEWLEFDYEKAAINVEELENDIPQPDEPSQEENDIPQPEESSEDENRLKPVDSSLDPELTEKNKITEEQKDYLFEKEKEKEQLVKKLEAETLAKQLEKEKEKEQQKQSGIKLSEQQKQALSFILNSKKHILLTGKAGAGKSTIIKVLRKLKPDWAVCSTTGKAAVLIGGVTIDHLFSYDRELNITKYDNYLKRTMAEIGEGIIVDEASMVGLKMFNHICKVAFAFGKRLILVGDWGQAKPVKDDWFFPLDMQDFDFIKLTECFRQKDGEFLECLDKLRTGIQDEQVNNLFSKRICPIPPMDDSCLLLFPFNKQADAYNQNRVNKLLEQEKKEGKNGTGILLKSRVTNKTDKCPTSLLKTALNNTPFAHNLTLAIGCKILITRNQLGTDGTPICVNGDTGTLVGIIFQDNEIKALEIYIERTGFTYSLCANDSVVYNEKHEPLYTISGFPVKLGYALTIHKAQGMTIPKVWVDLKSIHNADFPNHGITYVALSRVRKIEDLWVNYWDEGLAYVERPVKPYL